MATATDRISAAHGAEHCFSSAERQRLRRKLLAWYETHARDLPWRRSRDPYRVWISEVMLQQTQVATVRDYYRRFVRAFPNVTRLAAAEEQEVLRLWEGLGYYRRARQLHLAAKKIVAEYGGRVPRSVSELRTLPGIGRYTAGAIVSIAFDQRAPILEANTIRLISRLVAFRGDPQAAAGQRLLWQVAEEILPHSRVAEFNQALMELGSLICRPGEPKCGECPLSSLCRAYRASLQQEIPGTKRRKEIVAVREAALIVRKQGRILMRRCGVEERWAGLWDFPRFAIESCESARTGNEIVTKLRTQTGITCERPTLLRTMRHGVTRYRITLEVYAACYSGGRRGAPREGPVQWVAVEELANLPLSTTGRKIAASISQRA